MLDRYERRIMEELLDIIKNEDLKSAPAGRVIEIGGYSFHIVAKLFGEEIVMTWDDDKGSALIMMSNWIKRWPLAVDILARAIRTTIED